MQPLEIFFGYEAVGFGWKRTKKNEAGLQYCSFANEMAFSKLSIGVIKHGARLRSTKFNYEFIEKFTTFFGLKNWGEWKKIQSYRQLLSLKNGRFLLAHAMPISPQLQVIGAPFLAELKQENEIQTYCSWSFKK